MFRGFLGEFFCSNPMVWNMSKITDPWDDCIHRTYRKPTNFR